jgi:hypothetical protein
VTRRRSGCQPDDLAGHVELTRDHLDAPGATTAGGGLQSCQPLRPDLNQPRPGAAQYAVIDIKVIGAKKSAIGLRGRVDVDMSRVNVRGPLSAITFIPDLASGDNPRLNLSDLVHDIRP